MKSVARSCPDPSKTMLRMAHKKGAPACTRAPGFSEDRYEFRSDMGAHGSDLGKHPQTSVLPARMLARKPTSRVPSRHVAPNVVQKRARLWTIEGRNSVGSTSCRNSWR